MSLRRKPYRGRPDSSESTLSYKARIREVLFIPVPEEVQDADGFLKREFWLSDVTRANDAYGNVIYEAVVRAFR